MAFKLPRHKVIRLVKSARPIIGALAYDIPRWGPKGYAASLNGKGRYNWVDICNRNELLLHSDSDLGVKCDWRWTSELYLPKVFPYFGRWLFRRAFRDFPIELKENPAPNQIDEPEISFVIGHRGLERLPLLLATLKSIAGQADCRFECIVVEQDNEPLVKGSLPRWVRYVHTQLPRKDIAYSRSWAFNEGAKVAASKYLILHDNDMLVPKIYAKKNLHFLKRGYGFTNLKRFIYYLDSRTSKEVEITGAVVQEPDIKMIIQNLEGGGSVGANKKDYWRIGGFDEGFVGWGGEDNEFWERANVRKVYPFGYLPLIHLWHSPQLEKKARANVDTDGIKRYKDLSKEKVEERIERLLGKQ